MTHIIYMPLPSDSDETIVDGIKFTAYEPVDVPDVKAVLIEKLEANPWFTAGTPDPDRHAAWTAARDRAAAKAHE